ncbi:hypothetical protein ABKN59_000297 [Abortiporus biennis]
MDLIYCCSQVLVLPMRKSVISPIVGGIIQMTPNCRNKHSKSMRPLCWNENALTSHNTISLGSAESFLVRTEKALIHPEPGSLGKPI